MSSFQKLFDQIQKENSGISSSPKEATSQSAGGAPGTAVSTGNSFMSLFKQVQQRNSPTVDDSYIRRYLSDSQNFLNRTSTSQNWQNGRAAYDDSEDEYEDLVIRTNAIKSYLKDNQISGELAEAIDEASKAIVGSRSNLRNLQEYYRQWDDQDAFDDYQTQLGWYQKYQGKNYKDLSSMLNGMEDGAEKEWLASFAYQTDLDEKKNLDLDAYSREIAALEQQLENYAPEFDWSEDKYRDQHPQHAVDAEVKRMQDEINRRKQYLAQAQRIQKKDDFSAVANPESEKYDADFDSKSGYVSTEQDGKLQRMLSQYSMGYDDLTYEYINNQNGIRDEIKHKASAYSTGETPFGEKGYDYMTEDEVGLYNYYYSMGGKASAEAYLDTIQEDLNQRKAAGMYQQMEGKTGAEMVFGVEAGIDQFKGGIKGAVRAVKGDDSYVAPSATQYASGMVREDLADDGFKLPAWLGGASLGQVGYDAITNTANMAPSILGSVAANFVLPGSGAVVGNALLGGSAAGSAYQEKINEGYSVEQARMYGAAIGASEIALNYALGGISDLGGILTNHAIGNALKGVENGVLKAVLKVGGSMGSEALEEGIQEALTPIFSNLLLNTDESIDWSQVAYSAILGGLTGGVFEGPKVIGSAIKNSRNATDGPGNATVEESLTTELASSEKSSAVDDKMSATEVVAKNATTIQLTPDIESFSRQFGDQAESVKRNYLMGQEMNPREDQDVALREYEIGFQAAFMIGKAGKKEALTSENVPYLSQSQREIAYQMGVEAAAAAKATAPKKAVTTAKIVAEDGSVGDTVNVAEIVSMDENNMTFRLEDGRTVTDDDLSFDKGQQVLASVWELGMDVKSANSILIESAANTAEDAAQAAGIEEAYRYGAHGYSMKQLVERGIDAGVLTDGQRQAAWNAGQISRQQAAAAAPNAAVTATGKGAGIYFDAGNGNVTAFSEATMKSLTGKRKAGVQAAMVLQKLGVGQSYHFFESYVNESGDRVYKDANGVERTAPNGWYDKSDGSIHIDLNAGASGEGLTLYTLSHELTHFVEQWSKPKYQALADFLVEGYAKGASVDELVMTKQAELSESRGAEVSYEEAYSEFIADSMEAMLTDGNVLEKLAELKAKDKSLFDKMREFFTNLAKKIQEIYKGLTPDSAEGKAVLEMKDQIEQIQQLFAEALADAGENFQAADGQKNTAQEGRQFLDRKKTDATQQAEQKAQLEDKYYARQIDKWDGKDHGGSFRVGKVSDPLLKIGIPDVDIWFDQSKAAKQLDGKAEVTKDVLKRIPYLLEHPIAISESYDNTVMVFGEMYDENGNPIVVALRVNSTNRRNHITLVNKIRSVGTRTHNLDKLLSDDAILYLNETKKETNRWFNALGRSTPFGGTKFGLIRSISFDVEKSNIISTESKNNSAIQSQDRSVGTSNRALLAGALESATQDEAELTKLREYRLSIEHLNKQEAKLAKLRADIREISFGKGPRDTAKLETLQENAEKIAKSIHKADKKLLGLEAAEPLQRVLEREKAKVQKRTKAKVDQMLEQRKDRREQTFMRHKIMRVITELNDLLTKPTKTRHVLPGLQKPVAEMLEALNMGTEEKQEQIRKQIARYQDLITHEKAQPDPQLDVIEAYKAKIEKLQNRGEKVSDNIARLKNAYANIKNSTDPEIAGGYMPELEEQLEIMRETVGDTPLQDMSLQQMDIVYAAYKMVLHNVRHANRLFGQLQKITAAEMTKEACSQMRSNGISTKDPPKLLKDAAAKVNEFSWQNLRPVDAFRRLGSEKMMDLFNGLVDGMAERGLMVREIRDYLVKARKDSHYSKFDFKKADTYTTVDGKEMKLNLAEKMSIYAYSKREAAFDHMTEGGFTYAKAQTYKDDKGVTRYHNNAGGTWKLSLEDLEAICGSLTEEQRRYADAMQKFLTEFGKRGNTVSRALFGIDLLKEQNYFPLMSNHDYLNSVQTDLGATQTAASLKNSGFTKHTTPGANNPIVLKNFDDVCLEHLDKMVNYIALTLPLENLRKVYDNVSSATPETDPQSTKALIGAVYGEEAKQYFDQFLKDANGTHGITGAKNPLAKLFNKSKAAAVSANFSVVIQQISAVVRASAEISPINLISARGYGKGTTRGKKSYEEMMTYSGLANIKDMGGYDVGSATGLKDYIGMEEAPNSAKKIWEKFQDVFGMGAEFMDKVGWTMIWNAVKREIVLRNQYTINSAEFYQACAERFNEVVVKTQVFDSVLSRSGYMRSNNDSVKYLTSFMGEPTVTAGMVFNSHAEVLRAVKTKKDVGRHIKNLVRTDSALIATLLLNGMLKAIPYAMRDDDEDESFWERWAKHLGDNLRGDLNPLNLLPVARDIISIFQGRTVERPDLALLADLFAAGQNAVEALTDDEKREELQAEDYFILAEDLLGAVGNMAGVPIQNIWRDVESYLRLWKDMTDGIEAVEMKESFVRGFTGNDKTKHEGIYDAMISGDTARLDALKATYKTNGSYESAVRKALRLHDPRIKEMANARYEGNYDRLEALSYEIEAEGIFDMATIRAAYEAERTAQAKERGITLEEDSAAEQAEESTVFSMEEYYAAVRSGSKDSIQTAYNALIEEKKQEYYLEREAEDSIASSVTSKVKGEYLDEDISRADAKSILTKYGGKSKAEAETEIKKWEFQMEYHYAWGSRDRCYRSGTITRSQLVSAVMDIEDTSREEAQEYVDFLDLEMKNQDVDITASEASSYFEHAKPHGISVEVYLDYKARTKGIQNDKDANGDSIPYTAVQKIMGEINRLPIDSDQKYALARSNGWAEKTIQKYKLW